MISKDDPRHKAAQDVIDAMYRFFELNRGRGAVQWLEDHDGKVVIFTRGEYRGQLMENIDRLGPPVEQFEWIEPEETAQ